MTITLSDKANKTVLKLTGDLTIYEARTVYDDIEQMEFPEEKPFALDLQGITELDTAGLQLLLYLGKKLNRQGPIQIIKNSPAIESTMNILGLDHL